MWLLSGWSNESLSVCRSTYIVDSLHMVVRLGFELLSHHLQLCNLAQDTSFTHLIPSEFISKREYIVASPPGTYSWGLNGIIYAIFSVMPGNFKILNKCLHIYKYKGSRHLVQGKYLIFWISLYILNTGTCI